MTFSLLLITNEQSRVVGTLWADDEAKARALIPALCGCVEGQTLNVRRSEDREIPLRIPGGHAMHFS